MLTPILPPELEDYIISFLREDSRTLCVCARVCKEWLTVCRTYLFDKVSFETPQAYASFVEQVLGSLRLQTSLEMVHRIEILSPQADGFMEQSLADTFLRDTHGTFLNLHILRISNVNWGYLLTSHTYKLFDVNATPPFPRLKELAITNVVFPSEHVLAQLLVSLPNLASLSLYGIAFPLGNWDWLFPTIRVRDSAPYRSTTLKTLSVDGYYPFAPPLVAWFVEQFPEARVSLRKLQFTSEYWVPLLDALGPTSALNTLVMPFPTQGPALRVSLAHLMNLSRLVVLLSGASPSSQCWSALASMLESLARRPRSRGLCIALRYRLWMPRDWARLDVPRLEMLDSALVKLASAIAPRPASLSIHPGDSTSDRKRGVPTLKFRCYIQPPREGPQITKSDVDDLVRRKLKKAAECGVLVEGMVIAPKLPNGVER